MIVKIERDYILNENLIVAQNRLPAVAGNGFINQIIQQTLPAPLRIGSPNDVVFIPTSRRYSTGCCSMECMWRC